MPSQIIGVHPSLGVARADKTIPPDRTKIPRDLQSRTKIFSPAGRYNAEHTDAGIAAIGCGDAKPARVLKPDSIPTKGPLRKGELGSCQTQGESNPIFDDFD
jgi:hypothetical protein